MNKKLWVLLCLVILSYCGGSTENGQQNPPPPSPTYPPPQIAHYLEWDPPTDMTGVTGYRVYWRVKGTEFTVNNSMLWTGVRFDIYNFSLPSGTFEFVVTSVGFYENLPAESEFSNMVEWVNQ